MRTRLLACAVGLLVATELHAQSDTTRRPPTDSAQRLTKVTVAASADDRIRVAPMQVQLLPAIAGVTAAQARQTVNLVDTQDAVKYLPSVFVRKRNNGDTQATVGTRTWGVGSSARTLVYADGVLLSALIANNNTIGAPRWGLVSPAEVVRVDMMAGPFSAAYAGNSMGAVLELTTRMPQKFEGSVEQVQAAQSFSLYGTQRSYPTTQTTAHLGSRVGRLSFRLSGNLQESRSQPVSYVTAAVVPANTSGAFPERNKLDAPANVIGATGLLRTTMANARLKVAYDVARDLQLAYSYGHWQNDASSGVETYLRRDGTPTFAGAAGFASGNSEIDQRHSSQSLALRGSVNADWEVELIGSQFRYDSDRQRQPTSASASGTTFGSAGRMAVLDGTQWRTLDAKAVWHAGGRGAQHIVSAGAHHDRYDLRNPTFTTAEWRDGSPTGTATEGRGSTETQALFIQDKWRIAPSVALTFGGRFEQWRAFGGFNANGSTRVTQPEVRDEWFSPKAVLAWTPNLAWTTTASVGKAVRFATASELYQLVSTGVTFTSPAPDLRPDNVWSSELRVARNFDRGMLQVAVFQDDVRDAIIAQFLPLAPGSGTLFSYLSNVDRVRARGTEVVATVRDVLVPGLSIDGSVTYLSARTLALSGAASASAPAGAAVGKFLPNIPEWRGTVAANYRAGERIGLTLAGRYSGKLYTTLDNADVNPNTWQGFGEWFVADARATYRVDSHWTAALGVDNLLDRKYFLFHPFPQRTVVGSLRYAF